MDSEEANLIYKNVGKGRLALKTAKTGGKAALVTLQKMIKNLGNQYKTDQLASAAINDKRKTKIRELFQLKNSKLSFISDIVNKILEENNDLSYLMADRTLSKDLVYSSYGEAIERLADYLDMLEENDPNFYKNLWRDKKGKLYKNTKEGVVQIWSPKKGFTEEPYLVLGQEKIPFHPEGSELLFSALAEEAFEKASSKNFRPNIKNVFKVKTDEELEEKLKRIFNRLKKGESVNLSKDEYLALEYYVTIENYKLKLSASDPNRTIFDQNVVKGLRKAMKNPKTTQVALELFDLYNQKGKITTSSFKKVLSNHGFNTTSIPRNYITNDLILRTNNLPQLVNEKLFINRLAPNAASVIKDASKEIATEFAVGTILDRRIIGPLFSLIFTAIAFLTNSFQKRVNKKRKEDENNQIKRLADAAEKILEFKQEPPKQLLEFKQESLPDVKKPKSMFRRRLERDAGKLKRKQLSSNDNTTVKNNNQMEFDPFEFKFTVFDNILRRKVGRNLLTRSYTNPQLSSYVDLRGIAKEAGLTSDEINSSRFEKHLRNILRNNGFSPSARDIIIKEVKKPEPVPTLDIEIDPLVEIDSPGKIFKSVPTLDLKIDPLAEINTDWSRKEKEKNVGNMFNFDLFHSIKPNPSAFHHDIPGINDIRFPRANAGAIPAAAAPPPPPPPPNFDRAGGGENINPDANFNMFEEDDAIRQGERRRRRAQNIRMGNMMNNILR